MYYRHNIILVIAATIFSLIFWIYRKHGSFQVWTIYEKNTRKPQNSTKTTMPPLYCPEIKVSQGDLVTVKRTNTLLLSAYQEHRTGKREVRVVGVAFRSETVAYRCIFCCEKQLHISEGVNYIQDSHFGFPYGTTHIMCPVPLGCETPSHISVTSAAADSHDEYEDFLEVKNQKPHLDSFPYKFTVCISTMYDFTNVLQLVQSLEMLQLLGVDRVAIYKTSNSPETQRILDYYTDKGLVQVISWSWSRYLNVSRGWLPLHGPGDLHYYGQIPALHDCIYRYMYQSTYLAQHDIDELILPQSVNSWVELLPLLKQKYGSSECFMFENNVFPITVTRPPPGSQTLSLENSWQNVTGVNILVHLYQEPIIRETFNSNFKIIVNPRAVISPTVHGLSQTNTFCSWIDRNMARMYHTRPPKQNLKPDQLIYDGRLLSYSVRLTPVVNAVLKENGFLPKDGA